jgi:hypothetical protein
MLFEVEVGRALRLRLDGVGARRTARICITTGESAAASSLLEDPLPILLGPQIED